MANYCLLEMSPLVKRQLVIGWWEQSLWSTRCPWRIQNQQCDQQCDQQCGQQCANQKEKKINCLKNRSEQRKNKV